MHRVDIPPKIPIAKNLGMVEVATQWFPDVLYKENLETVEFVLSKLLGRQELSMFS